MIALKISQQQKFYQSILCSLSPYFAEDLKFSSESALCEL